MKPTALVWLVLWVFWASVLVACGSSPEGAGRPAPYGDAAIPGLPEAGPLPRYQMAMSLDPAAGRLKGRQQVWIPNGTGVALTEVVFRLYPNLPQYGGRMGVGPIWVDGRRSPSELRSDDSSLVVRLPRRLGPEASVTISMTYYLDVPRRDDGYSLLGYSQGVWSLPDAYPLLAVHEGSIGDGRVPGGPEDERWGWHEDLAPAHGDAVFATAAMYDVSLTLPSTLTLATTGSITGDTVEADSFGRRTYRITGGPLREFAWLASADYQVLETTAYGVQVRSYHLVDDAPAGQAALTAAAAALRIYSDAFGPYPFPEMVVAEAPLLYFGMEYPGLNLIGVALYRGLRDQLEMRVAHEVAHQWWYAQVGNDQVNRPWLDEGLAEYSTATYYQEVYGAGTVQTLVTQRWLAPYQFAVESGSDAVVDQPSAAFGEEYETIVYAKAALFFDAVRQQVGDDTYRAILREYLERYRWRIATPDDLLRVAESVSGQGLRALYNDWILGREAANP